MEAVRPGDRDVTTLGGQLWEQEREDGAELRCCALAATYKPKGIGYGEKSNKAQNVSSFSCEQTTEPQERSVVFPELLLVQ